MLEKYFRYVVEKKGSDIHLKSGNYPLVRIDGELEKIENSTIITDEDILELEREMLTADKKQLFDTRKNLDFSYTLDGVGRFRIDCFKQKGKTAIAARRIEDAVKNIEELGLPDVLKEILLESRGLILVTGATGSGKSTTVSAMLEYINSNYVRNIITLEDPIEYLFKEKKSYISQREIPDDVSSYSDALKFIMRQDPDIIFIGELRDKETIEAALKASETGHLVIATLHTVNAAQTVSRIIDYFPQEQHKQIRYQLSDNLKAVVSQRLLAIKGSSGRIPAVEIMRSSPTIRELLLTIEGNKEIPEAIRNGKAIHKMQTFDQSIADLFLKGMITYEVAIEAATVKREIELLKGGISHNSTADYYRAII